MRDQDGDKELRCHGARRGWLLRGFFGTCGAVVMMVVFFAVVTPVGFVLRLAGRDRLRLRADRRASTYWIARGANDNRRPAMNRQF
jgi:hypothetical protein